VRNTQDQALSIPGGPHSLETKPLAPAVHCLYDWGEPMRSEIVPHGRRATGPGSQCCSIVATGPSVGYYR
jgi:hypothetical protein